MNPPPATQSPVTSQHEKRLLYILAAMVVGSLISLGILVVFTPSRGDDDRIVATRAAHQRNAQTQLAEYLADPGLGIRGAFLGGAPADTRVVVVECRQLAHRLQSDLDSGISALPFALPIAGTADVAEGQGFAISSLPLGRYTVFGFAPDRQPVRRDGVTVRDSIGGSAVLRLAAQAFTTVPIPPPLADARELKILPVYSGHWPDSSWQDLAVPEARLEHRDPDGWPAALLWSDGETTGWLRVVDGDAADSLRLEPCELGDLVADSRIGSGALAASPFAVLGTAARATQPPSDSATEPQLATLELESRLPFAEYQVEASDGAVHSTFADVSGTAVFRLAASGPALVRTQTTANRLSLPTGVFLRPATIARLRISGIDILVDREALLAPRLEPESRHCLCGFVMDSQGEPVPGSVIAAFPEAFENIAPKTATTDSNGFYRIDGIRDGLRYAIRYGRSASFGESVLERRWMATPTASETRSTRVDLQLSGSSIEVAVPDGKFGDVVLVYGTDSSDTVARAYLAVDAPAVVWRDLPIDTYRLVLERDSNPIAELEIQPSPDEATLTTSGPWRSL